ncbi:Homeodomain-like protein [Tuber brumale]|nr:Homeodomain-like protein [Tuber brumale]
MPRERRKWTEGEDAILRDAVLKGGEGACDWHLIASCIPGRTNKDCRKRWHYKVAATVNKGPWEVAEDERLWAAVQEHGSRWALVAQVVKTRNGDQCSKRWYDALDPSIDHSPWTPEEDVRLLEAIEKHGRNWKAIVKAYFPRRTSLSAKNRYSLLIRKMEPKNKQSQSGGSKKANQKSSQKSQSQADTLEASKIPAPQFRQGPADMEMKREGEHSRSHAYRNSLSGGVGSSLNVLFEPSCQPRSANKGGSSGNTNPSSGKQEQQQQQPVAFESPLLGQKGTPSISSYTSPSSDCPALSPADWSSLVANGNTGSEASFPVTTPSGQSEDMSLFFNDLHLTASLSQGDLLQFAAKNPERMVARSISLDQGTMGNRGIDFRRNRTPRPSNAGQDMNDNTGSRVITVMINREVPETVNSIVNHIGREEGVSIAIHLG